MHIYNKFITILFQWNCDFVEEILTFTNKQDFYQRNKDFGPNGIHIYQDIKLWNPREKLLAKSLSHFGIYL